MNWGTSTDQSKDQGQVHSLQELDSLFWLWVKQFDKVPLQLRMDTLVVNHLHQRTQLKEDNHLHVEYMHNTITEKLNKRTMLIIVMNVYHVYMYMYMYIYIRPKSMKLLHDIVCCLCTVPCWATDLILWVAWVAQDLHGPSAGIVDGHLTDGWWETGEKKNEHYA